MFKKLLLIMIVALVSNVSFAAVDMFLKIPTIPGESLHEAHKDEIDVLAWSWGLSNNGRSTCIEDIQLTKKTDKASPALLMNIAIGIVYPTVTLSVHQSDTGREPLDYLIVTMTNVSVSSIKVGHSESADRPTENYSLNFEKITFEYTPQNADGSNGRIVTGTISSKNGKC
jgi:type VI secretion system secreted protein Hcp